MAEMWFMYNQTLK